MIQKKHPKLLKQHFGPGNSLTAHQLSLLGLTTKREEEEHLLDDAPEMTEKKAKKAAPEEAIEGGGVSTEQA